MKKVMTLFYLTLVGLLIFSAVKLSGTFLWHMETRAAEVTSIFDKLK
jgi:hypothetical protein